MLTLSNLKALERSLRYLEQNPTKEAEDLVVYDLKNLAAHDLPEIDPRINMSIPEHLLGRLEEWERYELGQFFAIPLSEDE